MTTTLGDWREVLEIFGYYIPEGEGLDTAAEHDMIYLGPSPELVNEKHLTRLAELHVYPDKENDCFYIFT